MKKIIPVLSWLAFLLLIAIAMLCFETDLLWKVQQYNLFLDTPLFFSEQMLEPGGFLSYVSCYFTQFFYHPWIGVLMLCGWWLLLMWLTKRTFLVTDRWAMLALVPVAILVVADMGLGYWHYFMKLRGYFFVPTIGTTVGLAMLWAFRVLPQKQWLRIVAVVVATAVGYPLLGIYGLATVLLMGIWIWRFSGNRTQSAILTTVALLSIIAIPLLYYRYVYYQTNIYDLWTTALPVFTALESFPIYYTPYYLLGAFFLLMTLFYRREKRLGEKTVILLQGILAVVLLAGIWHFWYKDENFHHELVMQHCIEQADWDGVILEGEKQGELEPTRAIVVMHNLALQRLGRQLTERYSFPNGNAEPTSPLPVSIFYHVFGRMIYYQYGMLNDCHRLCMEEGVEFGWRVETQEYLARCSLLSGETQAARKALNLLRHTLYHGTWADTMQQLVDHPEQIAEAHETGPVSHMLHYSNALGGDSGKIEEYVMGQLAVQDSEDPYFQEQAVLATLWLGNSRQFWPRFFHYAHQHPQGPMPRVFQEAAYLFGKLDNRPDIAKMPFDQSVKTSFDAFMKAAKQYDNQPAEIGRAALYPFYGSTYFFEYYFQRHNH